MDQPAKRLRRALDQDDGGRELEAVMREFMGNWDVFRYLLQYVTLEDLNRMCNVNLTFRMRCENDTMVQQLKTRLIFKRKAQSWKLRYEEGFSDREGIIPDIEVFSQYGHKIHVNVEAWNYRGSEESMGFTAVLEYLVADAPLDTIDFNIYKRLYSALESLGLNQDFGDEHLMLNIHRYDYDTPTILDVMSVIAEALIAEGFYYVAPDTRFIQECVACDKKARFRCKPSGELFCSQQCFVNGSQKRVPL